jgi:hypothetical protein
VSSQLHRLARRITARIFSKSLRVVGDDLTKALVEAGITQFPA